MNDSGQKVEIGIGWERHNRIHFDDIVVNYEKSRWDYPTELFNDVINYQGGKSKMSLEIGAGTGKATAPFLDARYDVTAVELGANMSAFLRDKFKGNRNFSVITASFEDAILEDNCYDLIYSASAFHWVDPKIGCPKVFSLLKNGGTFALFRSNVDSYQSESLYEDIEEQYEKHYFKPYKKPIRTPRDEQFGPSSILRGYGFEGLEDYGFTDIFTKLYDVTLTYDADKYIALQDTMSDHRSLPEDDRTALYSGIKDVIIRHGGIIEVNHFFQLYMGRKP